MKRRVALTDFSSVRKFISRLLIFALLPISAVQIISASTANAAAPGAPTITKIEFISNKQAKIYFTAPASNGGSAITDYKYSTDSNAKWKLRTDGGPSTSSPIIVTERSASNGALGNGLTTFSICAVNGAEVLATCANPSNLKTATSGTPTAPTINSITTGNGQLSVSLTAPTSNGGASITNYGYSTDGTTFTALSPAVTTSSGTFSVTVPNLTNGTTYSITFAATNTASGTPAWGTPSNTLSGTPTGPPTAPSSISASSGDTVVNLSWGAPSSNGGLSITGYFIEKQEAGVWSTVISNTNSTSRTYQVTGLTNGTTYSFRVSAINSFGTGPAATSSATPSGVPSAPTISAVNTTAGIASISLNFTAPSSNGGSTITNYQYSTDNGTTWYNRTDNSGNVSTSSPLVVSKLSTNGTTTISISVAYSILIRAVNGVGNGNSSNLVSATVPSAVSAPNAPTITSVDSLDGSLQVNFSAASNGGATITNYSYSTNGTSYTSFSPSQTSSPLTISGLNNGTSYPITIKAINSQGSSVASNSVSGTPYAAPGPPTNILGTTGTSQTVELSWTAPTSTIITGYFIEYQPSGGSWTTAIANTNSTSTFYSVTGLTNGTTYSFRISAINDIGTSSAASAASTYIPASSPDAPTVTGLSPGSATLTVTVSPGSANGSAITSYMYSTDGGVTYWSRTDGGGSSSTITITKTSDSSGVTNLTNGVTYTVYIQAVNAYGTSSPSNSLSATPQAANTKPDPPTGVTATAGDLQATVSWTAPVNNGGATITTYTVTSSPGSKTCSTTSVSPSTPTTNCTVTGLTNGTSYTFTVTATNSVGTSNASTASSSVTPTGAALTPTFGTPTATADGFTVQITNYSASYTWTGSATASGSVAISGTGLVTVTGVAAGTSSTATINTARTGYTSGSATVSGTSAAAGAAVISELSKSKGGVKGGDTVTIKGSNFNGVSKVKFGTVEVTINSSSSTEIVIQIPENVGITGSQDVIVETSDSSATFSSGYTFVPSPTISSLSVDVGPVGGGTSVIITGTNFLDVTGTSGVKFGDADAASYVVDSDTQITAVAPATTLGTKEIKVTNINGTSSTASAANFRFKNAKSVSFGTAPTNVEFGVGAGAHSVSATATLGTVTYSSLTPTNCSVNASTGAITVINAGECEIAADSASTDTELAATQTTQKFTIGSKALDIPGSFVASTTGDHNDRAVISFGSVANANKYIAKVYNSSGTLVQTIADFTSGSTITGLDGDSTYQVSITAAGTGNYKNSSEATKISVKSKWTSLSSVTSNRNKISTFKSSNAGAQSTKLISTKGSFTIDIPQGALTDTNIPIEVWELYDTATATSYLPDISYVAALAVAWQAADGTSPTLAHPITMTVEDPAIKVGSHVYLLVGNTYEDVGTATEIGKVTFTLTKDPGVFISAPAKISPSTQSVNGTVGSTITSTTAYTATDFSGTISYSLSGGTLPSGLNFDDATGVISGTPTTTISSTVFTVTASSTDGQSATATITLSVSAAGSLVPNFGSTTSTSDGFTVSVTNYNSNYTFAASTSSGSISPTTLTAGNTLLTVSGLAAGATATITVTTTRTGYASGSATVSGSAIGAPSISPSTQNVSGTTGTAITDTSAFTPSNISGTVAYTVTSGTLPAGLSISSSTGVISGTPTETNSSTLTITGSDGTKSATATVIFSISAPGTPVITPATQTISGTVGSAISSSTAFTASNFSSAPSYALSGGSLPAGLNFDSVHGVISGTPSESKSSTTFTVTATSGAQSATASITLAISASSGSPAPNKPLIPTDPLLPLQSPKPVVIPIDPKLNTTSVIPPISTSVTLDETSPSVYLPIDGPEQSVFSIITDRKEVVKGTPIKVKANTAAGRSINISLDAYGYTLSGNTWTISALTEKFPSNLIQNELSNNSLLIFAPGQSVATFGSGFVPKSQIDIYVFSVPTKIGSVIIDKNGRYKASFKLPIELALGNHVLQAIGKTRDNIKRVINFPITINEIRKSQDSGQPFPELPATKKATKSFDIYFDLNSYYLNADQRQILKKSVALVKSKLTDKSEVSISIKGWVQPTNLGPYDSYLSASRAKAVASYLKALGLKGKYTVKAAGKAQENSAQSRKASVLITWRNPN
ncbi:MAG: fibronectin type III domain-containing protein [Candidatus Nanopelagicaceae bacterium]